MRHRRCPGHRVSPPQAWGDAVTGGDGAALPSLRLPPNGGGSHGPSLPTTRRGTAFGMPGIGVPSRVIAAVLAAEMKGMPIGESAQPDVFAPIRQAVESSPSVENVIHIAHPVPRPRRPARRRQGGVAARSPPAPMRIDQRSGGQGAGGRSVRPPDVHRARLLRGSSRRARRARGGVEGSPRTTEARGYTASRSGILSPVSGPR